MLLNESEFKVPIKNYVTIVREGMRRHGYCHCSSKPFQPIVRVTTHFFFSNATINAFRNSRRTKYYCILCLEKKRPDIYPLFKEKERELLEKVTRKMKREKDCMREFRGVNEECQSCENKLGCMVKGGQKK